MVSSLSQTMANSNADNAHALLVTYPLQGHIIPSVHLAIKLASKGITITFVNTEYIHHQTYSAANKSSSDNEDDYDIFSDVRASGLDIRYEIISDGLPVDFDRSLNHDDYMGTLLNNFSCNVEALVERKRFLSGDKPITCIVADTFFVWPSTISKKLGLTYVSFWTEPALVFTLYYHIGLLKEHGHFDSPNGNRTDTITYIPGVHAISPSGLTSYLQDTDTTTVCHKIIDKAFEQAHDADFILCNTAQELEPAVISALQLEKPFYAVGPIFPQGFSKSNITTSLWTESDCTQWLDSNPPGSVLYVSFGSYAHLCKKELEEIAYGVMNSKANFIWVLRNDIVSSNDPNPLPKEFVEETEGRGLVVKWCCQIEVLKHKSIGGFLTHCGWNSTLEGIWSEVPFLCYPLYTDQFTNRKLLVQDWRIGIDLGGAKTNVGRDEVSEKIGWLMREKEAEHMRKQVKKVKRELESAINQGGSSVRNLDGFVKNLRNHTISQ